MEYLPYITTIVATLLLGVISWKVCNSLTQMTGSVSRGLDRERQDHLRMISQLVDKAYSLPHENLQLSDLQRIERGEAARMVSAEAKENLKKVQGPKNLVSVKPGSEVEVPFR